MTLFLESIIISLYKHCLESEKDRESVMTEERKEQARRIVETLAKHGIAAELKNVAEGPSVTRFDLGLCGNGVTVEQGIKYGQEIASALSSCGIRIYPNVWDCGNGISVEVPNAAQEEISYSAMMQENRKERSEGALRFTVGKDVEGKWVHADICNIRLRRFTVGGLESSVFLRAMIMELAEKYSPAEMRLILLDGRKEFSGFRDLPHLISDVAADPVHALGAMEWAAAEMDRRFSLLNQKIWEGVSAYDLQQYNAACADEEKLPRILIVAAEANDCFGHGEEDCWILRAAEDRIEYLAMKGHAVGIHLILATEHPSSGSFTRILRLFSHSCIAFQMFDGQTSRLFLGEEGVEKLIGSGDLLYRSGGEPVAQRIQGIHIYLAELERAVSSVRGRFEPTSLYADAVFADADDR